MSRKRTSKPVAQDTSYTHTPPQHVPQRKKVWSIHDLRNIKPKTDNQARMFEEYMQGQHVCVHGVSGTGKSFIGIYLALNDMLSPHTDTDNIIIVRSAVSTRDLGFLPGTIEEKAAAYEVPYAGMFHECLGRISSYQDLKDSGKLQFLTSSFVRGATWDNAIVVVDECQNMNWEELDGIITRLGVNSRIILCGDIDHQLDLKRGEKSGFRDAIRVVSDMPVFSTIEFTVDDIVRSDFVKQWIIARIKAGL